MVLLQITFRYSVPAAMARKAFDYLAPKLADMPGLVWKVWGLNEEEQSGCGTYLFDNETNLRAYLESEVFEQISGNPFVEDLTVQPYQFEEAPSRITRGLRE